jgi:hypothetical protein
MDLKKGLLKSFNDGTYTATVDLAGSQKAYLEDVTVARNLPVEEMVAGRKLVVAFPDEHNAGESVVIAVYV